MAKITSLDDAKKVIKRQHAEIASLQKQLEQARARKQGMRSSDVEDRYTDMEAPELRPLIIRRGGNPDEIVEGLHARQRAIAMREWLRSHSGKTKGRRLSNREVREIADGAAARLLGGKSSGKRRVM